MLEITPAERLFVKAQTPGSAWLDRPVEESTITRLYDLVRLAPTAFNARPARFVFVRSPEADKQLLEIVSRANRAKVQNAPLTVILGYDLRFFEELPRLFPKYDASGMFRDDPRRSPSARRFIRAPCRPPISSSPRALWGWMLRPLWGFDPECVEATFFPSGTVRANVLCCLGYAERDPAQTRHPRLDFHEVCRIV